MSEIKIDVFCDESYGNEKGWLYIGVLFVPHEIRTKLFNELMDRRCLKYKRWSKPHETCIHPCGHHERNDTEITYKKIGNSAARDAIALSWMRDFHINFNNRMNKSLVYFKIIGVDLSKLDKTCFGPHCDREEAIYNRFFRMAIMGAKYYFSEYSSIVMDNIYHDKGNQESYQYFSWHTPKVLNLKDRKISVTNPQIQYVDSDHRKIDPSMKNLREASNFIQFIDVIMGSFVCCLTASSNKPEKVELARAAMPLLSRLLDSPKNPNSSYHYYRKQQISFFPKKTVDYRTYLIQTDLDGCSSEVTSSSNQFYTRKEIRLARENQQTLFKNWI
jgi:hypothetical protein